MIRPGATVGFVGLGKMGGPMATRLAEAGYQVQGYDVSEQAVRSWAERAEGARPAASLGTPAALSAAATSLWAEAARALPADADHTEIARWLED
jgi:6-phosphogluconate dehydrogenase (decarboxylating)